MTTVQETICPPILTLSEVTERYLAVRQVNKKKYFASYLIVAGKIWQELFQKTLFSTKSVWKELKAGDPYSYVDIPNDCSRFFEASVVDDCGNIVPVYYNPRLNVVPKPVVKKCGCGSCDCGGLCEDLNSTTLTTRFVFTINAIQYFEKTWLKYCSNGDILEYKETPVKKYNDFIGSSGDFNNDFNDDFSSANPSLANFDIETVVSQRKICSLDTKPCGCPVDSEENISKVVDMCGCFLPCNSHLKVKRCDRFLPDTNNNCQGEIKISECGNRIFYRPMPHRRHHKNIPTPNFLLLNYQTNGSTPGQEVMVPDYAELAMWKGIDYLHKAFNNIYSLGEKQLSKIEYEDECNRVIKFLNPLSLEWLSNIMDSPIKW